ncbi:MAG: hypothetical protein EBT14_09040, partial [Betaproteobacteria bacterium]|nr:hypothetical protein [Betaproteobacteria bacterium]
MRLRLPSTAQVLLAAVLIIQIPLWFGQGGLLHVWRLERQLDQQLQKAEQQKPKASIGDVIPLSHEI